MSAGSTYYVAGVGVLALGAAFASVPLYKIFCQATSLGGTVQTHNPANVARLKPVLDRTIKVSFCADCYSCMQWNFKPLQESIKLRPGETALAFYQATNSTDEPIDGVASYNVIPFDAAAYFYKIQCFCFEEQRLNPGEQVDMPVFFYIDPDFVNDPAMENVDHITLSYTFFEAKSAPKSLADLFSSFRKGVSSS